jgi:hypothetical protein
MVSRCTLAASPAPAGLRRNSAVVDERIARDSSEPNSDGAPRVGRPLRQSAQASSKPHGNGYCCERSHSEQQSRLGNGRRMVLGWGLVKLFAIELKPTAGGRRLHVGGSGGFRLAEARVTNTRPYF